MAISVRVELRGVARTLLMGKHPEQKRPIRWEGGLGHELGHALGLPHPKDTDKHASVLMWAGFYHHYPDTAYLTPEANEIPAGNPLIRKSDRKDLPSMPAIDP